MRCLSCGKTLPDSGNAPGSWHPRCIRAFFGTSEIPRLDISNATLEEAARQVVSAGFTVTGVQRKLSVHLSQEGRKYRLTLVGYPSGYILKPASPEYPYLPELEHVAMGMAEDIGITTVPHGLITLSDGSLAYITRRVDRRALRPHAVPMEDLCQLSERLTEDKYRGSYEQVAKTIARYSSRPGLDLSEYFLVLLFCFVVGNADMHLKNFSLYRPDDIWVLAPAYDLLPTTLVIPEDHEETALSLNGKKAKLTRQDFAACGLSAGLDPKAVNGLIDLVVGRRNRLVSAIEQAPVDLPIADRWLTLIDQRIAHLV